MSTEFHMAELFGTFLADGDVGNRFRFCEVEPKLTSESLIIFDFQGVENTTDSFANACFGQLAQNHPKEVLDKVRISNCTPIVQEFVLSAISAGLQRADRLQAA
jgi:hypothetical protein